MQKMNRPLRWRRIRANRQGRQERQVNADLAADKNQMDADE
jgi:hypothetical protein